MTKQIPTEVPVPRGQMSIPASIYAALAAVDPSLLPDEAVKAALRCQQWAANQPTPPETSRDAVHAWGAAVDEAIRDGNALPDPESVARAVSNETVFTKVLSEYFRRWFDDIQCVRSAIETHADAIVEQMRPMWISAVEELSRAVSAIPESVTTLEGLLTVEGGSEKYQNLRNAVNVAGRITHARRTLTRLVSQSIEGKAPEQLLIVRDYMELVKMNRDGDQLECWRNYVAALQAGVPWLPTRGEAIAAFEEIRRSWPSQRIKGAWVTV